MEMEEASEGSSRSVSPTPIRPRERLQRATASSALDMDENEETPFDAVYNQPLTRWKEDDIHLQYAAANARLPFDSMIDLEVEMFPEYTADQLHVNSFLYVRNMILNLWDMNPMYELALENVFDEMPVAYKSLSYLIVKTHAFLERYGYINFGVFSSVEELIKKNQDEKSSKAGRSQATVVRTNGNKANGIKIIVVGAGIAGLAAATQLKFFGFDVLIIEARDRVGGRVFTPENVQKTPCDMGPHLIEGSAGNPLMTLMNQTPVLRYPVHFECPIYDDDGVIPTDYCRKVSEHFRRLTEAVILLSKENQVHEIGGQWLSVQDAYDHMISLQEEKVAVQRREYFETIDKLAQRQLNQTKALDVAKSTMDDLAQRLRALIESDPTPIREDVALIENEAEFRRVAEIKCLRFELSEACNVYERLQAERNDVHHTMATVRKNEPSEMYLSGTDRRLLDFYFANLELRLGTCLGNVSLSGFANLMTNHFGTHHYAGLFLLLYG